jgi:predicted SprT family Zn-dependent metalloprotease
MESMLSKDAEKLALRLMKQHGLGDWTYATNSRKRTLGLCFSHLKLIELSTYFIHNNEPQIVRETILHEIAHALVGSRHGHDEVWMDMAERLGCQPRRKAKGAYMPPGPWQAHCGGCGQVFSRHRRPKYISGINCKACGPKLGRLQFRKVMVDVPEGAAANVRSFESGKSTRTPGKSTRTRGK